MSGYVPNPPKNYRYEEAKPVDIHAERWAEYEKYGKEPEPAPQKIGIALRIGVFFDGTGNNANNTAAGVLCGAQNPIVPQESTPVASRSWQIQTAATATMPVM